MWSKEICNRFVTLLVKNYKEDSSTSQSKLLDDAQKQLIDEGVIQATDTRIWRGLSDIRGDLLQAFKSLYPEIYNALRDTKSMGRPPKKIKVKQAQVQPAAQVQETVNQDSVVLCDMRTITVTAPSHNLTQYGASQQVQSQLHKLTPRSFFSLPAQTLPVLKTKKRVEEPKMTEVGRVVHDEHSAAQRVAVEDVSRLHKRIGELEELVLSQDDVIKTLTVKFEKLSADLNSYLEHATAAAPVPAPAPAPEVAVAKQTLGYRRHRVHHDALHLSLSRDCVQGRH